MIARDHDAAIEGKACQNGQRGFLVEQIIRVEIRHMFTAVRIGWDLHVRLKAENVCYRNFRVWLTGLAAIGFRCHVAHQWFGVEFGGFLEV